VVEDDKRAMSACPSCAIVRLTRSVPASVSTCACKAGCTHSPFATALTPVNTAVPTKLPLNCGANNDCPVVGLVEVPALSVQAVMLRRRAPRNTVRRAVTEIMNRHPQCL
jgi:hypothetical protein